jgi:NADH dehydrogenase [ubiquinone] 1 alpha subcomplex assembly factor 2
MVGLALSYTTQCTNYRSERPLLQFKYDLSSRILQELYADAQRQIRVKQNAALIEARDREEAENMKRLREETRAELLGAPSRPDTTATQTHGSHPTQQAKEGSLKGAAPSTSTNPWDAARNTPETEAWAPQLRRRGS